MTDSLRTLTAIIPAAGRGSRLGLSTPKVFAPLDSDFTTWDAIYEKVSTVAERIILVLSPEGKKYARTNCAGLQKNVEIVVQPQPLGMGDAIFGNSSAWADSDDLLIVWGDQFNLSVETLRACLDLHRGHRSPGLTLPVVRMEKPYVEYLFDDQQRLVGIQQSREGDICQPGGWSDMGVFLLSARQALLDSWDGYTKEHQVGSQTGEINFLPFLVHLSTREHWPVLRYEDADPSEALGINTPADLEQARKLVQRSRRVPKALA